jgi:hypothetical protein
MRYAHEIRGEDDRKPLASCYEFRGTTLWMNTSYFHET